MTQNQIKKQRTKEEQKQLDDFATSLSLIMGARVIPKDQYDSLNAQNQKLLERTKSLDKVKLKLLYTECKLQAFINYHSKWKPTTRQIERRLKKLRSEKLFIDFSDFPDDISDNLREAYNCYVNGLTMACYIMVLRTIEITVNIIFQQHNPKKFDKQGKPVFVPAVQKLNWVKHNKMIGGADYTLAKAFIEARNDSVHDIFVPTERQLMSAFETVLTLIGHLKKNIKKKK